MHVHIIFWYYTTVNCNRISKSKAIIPQALYFSGYCVLESWLVVRSLQFTVWHYTFPLYACILLTHFLLLSHPNIASIALTGALFGQGSGPVAFYYVTCSGTEERLLDCRVSSSIPSYRCGHHEDAGVRCSMQTGTHYCTYVLWYWC